MPVTAIPSFFLTNNNCYNHFSKAEGTPSMQNEEETERFTEGSEKKVENTSDVKLRPAFASICE